MTTLYDQLRQAALDLKEVGARFAVVGGLAVSARAEPRMTRDADFAVAVANDGEVEDLVFRLQSRGYRIHAAVEQEATGRISTIRLDRNAAVITDLLFASSGIENDIVRRATVLSVVPGLDLPIASVGDLIAMKLLARDDRRRPADADDLRALREVATTADWSTARTAVESIVSSGYARRRDLHSALDDLIAHGAYGPDLD